MNQLFDTFLVHPIVNILLAIYQVLSWFSVPYALGFAIILMTIVVRFLMYPLMHTSMKQQKKMQELSPELAKIKEKHKNDTRQQQMAQMELFKEHGVNPLGGCLPMLVQFPLFIALYNVLIKTVHLKSPDEINNMAYASWLRLTHLWDTTFFGLPLGQTPQQLLAKLGPAILLVCIVTGLLQLIQSKMMMPTTPATPAPNNKPEDFSASLQKQMTYMLPLMIGVFAFTFPLGLSLYWNTLTIFGIIQQYIVGGWGALSIKLWKK